MGIGDGGNSWTAEIRRDAKILRLKGHKPGLEPGDSTLGHFLIFEARSRSGRTGKPEPRTKCRLESVNWAQGNFDA
jgi:hypothetical protein